MTTDGVRKSARVRGRATHANSAQGTTNGPRRSGILIVDKPSGLTSRAVVDGVVRLVDRVKVGHAGTLDPLATGVLIVCVGTATRLVETLQRFSKTYRTRVLLGARSDTLDADGRITEERDPRAPSVDEVQCALASLVGSIRQTPPAYSALKIGGRRAHELARAGRAVELAARTVRIERICVLHYAWPRVELEIECGSGTYIRSIARDLGEALRCGGLVETLVRTRIGPFTLDQALDFSALDAVAIDQHLRPPLDAVWGLPRVVLDPDQLEEIGHGRSVPAGGLVDPEIASGPVALVDRAGNLAAMADFDVRSGRLVPRKVLV
jgi:tRNA pseudouridine55 synthase